ncbi:MAG: arylsulfatase [Gammaproteobacteria bacterium]|nr:arylsulfatase [Gammaproteobacteria bacterium]
MTAGTADAEDARPNVVLIVADDLGYSDTGSFGGEIRTPNLDALADQGIRLTNFHAAPTCGPTRAMLLTGVDHHRAGLASNADALIRLPELRGRPGYEGHLNRQVVTFARLLQDSGYRTYMTGKWDLGKEPGFLPTDRGFDRYFGIADGGASHFADAIGNSRPQARAAYFDGDQRLEQLPADFYSSTTYVDRLLGFVEGGDRKEPFFAYLAFTAPHWPLQVPDDWIDRYAGAYDAGWHAIREARVAKQRELGIVADDAPAAPQNRAVPDWGSLSPARRAVELKRMELHAAMIELMDREIGRFLAAAGQGQRETIVIFLSDNGAEANAVDRLPDNEYWIPATFDNRLDNMGRQGSYVWLGVGWGHAAVTPLRLYKSYPAEGGIRTPAIVYSSNGRFEPSIRADLVTVMDIAPTILDLAGATHPGAKYGDRDVLPMNGRSALDYLENRTRTVHGDEPIGWELYGNRALIRGAWKVSLTWPPEGDGRWQLFNLARDPGETEDLSASRPDLLEELRHAWNDYAEANGVAIFDEDLGYGRYP